MIVNESLFEFKKGMDPIDSLGMGRKAQIEKWLKSMSIEKYTINDDYTIDVNKNVNLANKNLKEIPEFIQFGIIYGNFDIAFNHLVSLRGCPKIVKGLFWCLKNELETLEFSPSVVSTNFWAHDNKLISLKGCPQKIGGGFSCNRNNLMTLKYGPKKIEGSFYCGGNPGNFDENDVKKICIVKNGDINIIV